jgi:hypothetical protein
MYRLKPTNSQVKKQEAQGTVKMRGGANDAKCGDNIVQGKRRVHSMTVGNIRIYSTSKVNRSDFAGLKEKIREI